jgi:hypothetical protein
VGLQTDRQIQIPVGAAVDTSPALSSEPHSLAVGGAFGHSHLNGFGYARYSTLAIGFRDANIQFQERAVVRLFDGDSRP